MLVVITLLRAMSHSDSFAFSYRIGLTLLLDVFLPPVNPFRPLWLKLTLGTLYFRQWVKGGRETDLGFWAGGEKRGGGAVKDGEREGLSH